MSQACLDSYNTEFGTFKEMIEYHEGLSKQSRWVRAKVNHLRVAPLDKTSKLYSDPSQFEPDVSEDSIKDTAENMALAIKFGGKYVPLRSTANKSLLDRAKISGTALNRLTPNKLCGVLNTCLSVHGSDATLILVRDEKVAACHSGDSKDYSQLDIDKLLIGLQEKLEENYPGYVFDHGYSDHATTSADFSLPDQREDLLGKYRRTLLAHGKTNLARNVMPGIRFSTSDTGVSSAKVAALINGLQRPIYIGSAIAVHHRRQSKVEDFINNLDMLFTKMGKTFEKMESLMDVHLDFPVNAMTRMCKKLSMPRKAALTAIDLFNLTYGGGPATAHDVFIGMQEIPFNLKVSGASECRLLTLEENLSRAVWFNWADYDLPTPGDF